MENPAPLKTDRGLVWLASYPKSGNTWTRAFLTNYLRNNDIPADINQMDGGPIASARELFDEQVGIEASDLTMEEVDRLRPLVYMQYAHSLENLEILKIHDAYTHTQAGQPLIPPEATTGTIYILRNPLDVAISYAHHSHCSIDMAIKFMEESDHALVGNPRRLNNQLRQILLTWSEHVLSWVDAPGMNVHVMRYEDMKRDPGKVFGDLVHFLGFAEEPERLQRAIEFSSFDTLKKQEQEHGFKEKMPKSESFFRQGKSGDWKDRLTPDQVQRIVEKHTAVMQRFGYLDQQGNLLDNPGQIGELF